MLVTTQISIIKAKGREPGARVGNLILSAMCIITIGGATDHVATGVRTGQSQTNRPCKLV